MYFSNAALNRHKDYKTQIFPLNYKQNLSLDWENNFWDKMKLDDWKNKNLLLLIHFLIIN